MAVNYIWSQEIGSPDLSFTAGSGYDVLTFDVESNDPFQPLNLAYGASSYAVFSIGSDDVTLQVDARQLTRDNVTLSGPGGLFIFGDDGTGTAADDGANTLNGGAGDDWLAGAGGNDTVNGHEGNDVLFMIGAAADGLFGNDQLDGGDGLDTVVYGSTVTHIDVNLSLGTATGGGNSTLTEIENVVAGGGDDTITGSAGDNFLSGAAGNDGVTGSDGHDTLHGGAGDDTLAGENGNDALDGGAGYDTMAGGAGDDSYYVNVSSASLDVVTELDGEGTDTVYSSVTRTLGNYQENLTLTGSTGIRGTGNALDNVITGSDGNDTLIGGNGHDGLYGGLGNDSLAGGAGNDTLDGGDGDDTMHGGDGDDVYYVVTPADKAFEESANGGIDTVFTQRSIDLGVDNYIENLFWTAAGGGGFCKGNGLDNLLVGIGQSVLMDGEGGIDTISYQTIDASTSVTIDLEQEFADALGTDTVTNCENAIGGLGDDSIIGDAIDNVLDGNDGADSMAGGYGDDTYIVDDAGDVVVETDVPPGGLVLPEVGGEGLAGIDGLTDTVIAAIDYSLAPVANVENLSLSGTATTASGNGLANVIVGNALSNSLMGGAGDDTLSGGGGSDTLNGGVGNDSMNGGSGNDVYFVNAAGDVAIEAAIGGADTVRAAVSETLAANVETLILIGASSINGTGNGLANRITGNGGANLINGVAGNDTMIGGAGNDTYFVSQAGDRVIEAVTGGGFDTVRASLTELLANGVERLVLTGAGAINGIGNSAANSLVGNAGNNVLDGRGGADTLSGAGGNDTLVWSAGDALNGGAGTDTLRLGAGNLNLANKSIASVERVDLKGDGANVLTVTSADVLDMSSTDRLTVVGDTGDQVNAAGFVQTAAGSINRYQSGAAVLLVEADVNVII